MLVTMFVLGSLPQHAAAQDDNLMEKIFVEEGLQQNDNANAQQQSNDIQFQVQDQNQQGQQYDQNQGQAEQYNQQIQEYDQGQGVDADLSQEPQGQVSYSNAVQEENNQTQPQDIVVEQTDPIIQLVQEAPEVQERIPSLSELEPVLEYEKITADLLPVEPEVDLDEGLFFDAESFTPESELSKKAAPRSVSPRTEPGSSFVVVNKDRSANSLSAQIVSAERAIALGRYGAAIEIYTKLLKRSPKHEGALLGRAVALQNLGRVDEAISAYQDVLDASPDNIDAHINMLGLVSHKYPAVALERLSKLSQENPGNIQLMGQIAFVQAQIGRYEEALESFAVIASSDTKNPQHILNMAIVADQAGLKSEAIEYYQQALDLDTVYGGGRSIARDEIFDRLANLR